MKRSYGNSAQRRLRGARRFSSGLVHTIYKPLLCVILQSSKTVTMGDKQFDSVIGDSLIVTADIPTVRQITQASRKKPYLAVVIELDTAIVLELNRGRVEP